MSLSRHKAYGASLFSVFIWGAFPTLIKGALLVNTMEQLLTIRFSIASLMLIGFFPGMIRKVLLIPPMRLLRFVLITVAVFYSQTYVLSQVPASWYIAGFTFVPILFLLIYREPLKKLGIMGSVLAVGGMALFFGSVNHDGILGLSNALWLVISIGSWVGYSIAAKSLQDSISDKELVAFTCFIGLVVSFAFWSVHGFEAQPISFVGVGLCFLSGVAMLLALITYSFGLREQPLFAMFSQYLEPVFGLLVAAIFIGERMLFSQYIAAGVIVLGTFLVGIATYK